MNILKEIKIVYKVGTDFKSNTGVFKLTDLNSAIEYKQKPENKDKCFITHCFKNEVILKEADNRAYWNGLVITDIDIKQYFKAIGWLDKDGNVLNSSAEGIMQEFDGLFKELISKSSHSVLFKRSKSGFGYHWYSYFDCDYQDQKTGVDACGALNRLCICQLKKELTKISNKHIEDLLVCNENSTQKIFDEHAENFKQALVIGNNKIVWKINDADPNQFKLTKEQIDTIIAKYPNNKKSSKTLKVTSKVNLPTKKVVLTNKLRGYQNRWNLANTAWAIFGDAGFEVISDLFDEDQLDELKGSFSCAKTANKQATKYGIEKLTDLGILSKDVEIAESETINETECNIIECNANEFISDKIETVVDSIVKNDYTYIYAGCGLGKTHSVGLIGKKFSQRSVVFLVPLRSIAWQNIKSVNKTEFEKIETSILMSYIPQTSFSKKWAIVCTGSSEKLQWINWENTNVITTYESFLLHYNNIPEDAIIICDEAHMLYNKAFRSENFCRCVDFLFNKKKNQKVVFFSATPSYELKKFNCNILKFIKPFERYIPVDCEIFNSTTDNVLYNLKAYISNEMELLNNTINITFYAFGGNQFIDKYKLQDKDWVGYNKNSKPGVLKSVNQFNWVENTTKLLVSAYGEAGLNLLTPGSTSILVVAATADEATQFLNRIRNKELIGSVKLIIATERINSLNIGGLIDFQQIASNINDYNRIVKNNNIIKSQLKEFDLGFIKDTVKEVNTDLLVWNDYCDIVANYNTQFEVFKRFFFENGFTLNEPKYVNYDEYIETKEKKTDYKLADYFLWSVRKETDFNNAIYLDNIKDYKEEFYYKWNNETFKEARKTIYKLINYTISNPNCINNIYTCLSKTRSQLKWLKTADIALNFIDIYNKKSIKKETTIADEIEILSGNDGGLVKKTERELVEMPSELLNVLLYYFNLPTFEFQFIGCEKLDLETVLALTVIKLSTGAALCKNEILIIYNKIKGAFKEIDANYLNECFEALDFKPEKIKADINDVIENLFNSIDTKEAGNKALISTCLDYERKLKETSKGSGGTIGGGSNKKSYKCIEDFTYKVQRSTIEFNAFKDQIYTVKDLTDAGLSDKVARKILKGDHFIINN